MEPDFPAAHSMDSCWFAVDRDGFIACFSTGEAGAMPESGYQGDQAYGLRDRLIRDLPVGDVLYDPRGRYLPGETLEPRRVEPLDWPTLVFLSSLAPIQGDIEAGRATPLRATEGYAVVFARLTAAQCRRLNSADVVLATDSYYDEPDEEQHRSLAWHGIYEYSHLCENWISGPYGRRLVPTRPVHIEQLPPNLRRNLKGTQLKDQSFADAVHIQPAEHWPCESWESGWQGLDGKRHAFPGQEADFEEQDGED
jgi:hypothetical protein